MRRLRIIRSFTSYLVIDGGGMPRCELPCANSPKGLACSVHYNRSLLSLINSLARYSGLRRIGSGHCGNGARCRINWPLCDL